MPKSTITSDSILKKIKEEGMKSLTSEELRYFAAMGDEKKPAESLKLAVKRMLPGGPLGKKQLTKLKIYSGENHPHSAQNPQTIDLSKLNNKNLIRN